jgi:predicted branched-subunit amino acid permease
VPAALVLGAQATAKGIAPLGVPLMAGLNFAGGSEFAAIGLWTSPPHLLLIAGVTLLVNSRHLIMGAALAPWLRHLPRRHVLPALFLMVDESWAMALADAKEGESGFQQRDFRMSYFLGASVGLYATWVHSARRTDRPGGRRYQPLGVRYGVSCRVSRAAARDVERDRRPFRGW